MNHFTNQYSDVINEALHTTLQSTWFYKQEIYVVDGLLTALIVTYDDIKDDVREYRLNDTWEQFLSRMTRVKPDWGSFSKDNILQMASERPHMTMGGWEGRTIYFIKGGNNAEFWTSEKAREDINLLLSSSARLWGETIEFEVTNAHKLIATGREHFADFERFVRVVFNFLFKTHISNGRAQVRSEPENEGIEIRDIIFANRSEKGFWKDLKDKYSCSEVVIDAKNTRELTRDDLRQLYCYLKPALGFWGFLVCRISPPEKIHAYNRTLFKNFNQSRGVMILCDEDMRRMVDMARRGHDASDYVRDRLSEFSRTI